MKLGVVRRSGAVASFGTAVFAAVFLLASWVLVSPPSALAAPEYASLTGSNRYDTAIKVSQAGFAPGVGAVVVATGEDFPDALSAAPLAAAYGGPVLLTHSAALDNSTAAEIARLQPGTIFVVGLSGPVVSELKAAFPDLAASADRIVVLEGTDRYDTARLVAERVKAKLGTITGVVLAPGDSFADALSVAPLAAKQGWPILLTPSSGAVPASTIQALSELEVSGGLEVGTYVDPGIPGLSWRHLAGTDRYDTSAKIAGYAATNGLSYAHVAVATGEDFPDALAAGPFLAADGGIMLLTRETLVPAPVGKVLMDNADSIGQVDFIGLEPLIGRQLKLLLSGTGWPEGLNLSTVRTGSQGDAVAWLEKRLTDLSYRPGPIDGVFDKRTYQAVVAFQKWEGLARDGVVGPEVWARLLGAARPTAGRSGSGNWIEVNKAKQVLLYVQNGTVTRTLSVSTGSANVGIVTPSGTFTVYAKSPKWDGPRYKPLYLVNVLAIHGYPSVPTWPASHGCIRVPLWDQDEFYPLIAVGTKVYVY